VSVPRASTAIGTDASAPPVASPLVCTPAPRTPSTCRGSIPRGNNLRLFLDCQQRGTIPAKSHSVADLRKVFERELNTSVNQFSTASLPNTLERTRSVKAHARDRQAADSTHRYQADLNGSDCGANDSEPTPTRPPPPVVQCPRTPTVRRVEGKALRAALLDELSRTIKHRAVESPEEEQAGMAEESPAMTRCCESTRPRPLLLSGILTIKTHPISPGQAETGPTESSSKRDTNNIPKEVASSHNSLPELSSSPYPQHCQAMNDIVAVKSSPSLPIVVPTAISDITREELSHIPPSLILLAGPNKIRKTRHRDRRRRQTHTPPKMKGLQNDSAADVVSPVRDGIHQFEQIGHPTSREADPPQLHENTPESPVTSTKRPFAKAPSTWGLRRGSDGLRALSLSRRKSSTPKGDDEVIQGYGKRKSSISFFGRFSVSNLDGAHSPEHSHPGPQRKLSASIKATLRKISDSKHHRREESAALAALKTLPSLEVLNKTAKLAPGPRTRETTPAPPTILSISKPKSHSTLAQRDKENCPSSVTRSLASRASWKEKTAAAVPVLSPAPVQACDRTTANHNSKPTQISQSWGRRAAAAAFDMGRRRFNGGSARRTSSSSVLSSSPSARLATLLRTKGSLTLDAGSGFVY
jgi:hypothetical protein